MKVRFATITTIFIVTLIWFVHSPPNYLQVTSAYVNGQTIIPAKMISSHTVVYPTTQSVEYSVSLGRTMYSPLSGTVSWSAFLTDTDYPPLKYYSGGTYTVFGNYSSITVDGKVFTYTNFTAKLYPTLPNKKEMIIIFAIGMALLSIITYFSMKNYRDKKDMESLIGPRMDFIVTVPAFVVTPTMVFLYKVNTVIPIGLAILSLFIMVMYTLWFFEEGSNEITNPTYVTIFDVGFMIIFIGFAYLSSNAPEVIYGAAVLSLVFSTYVAYYYPSANCLFNNYYALTQKDLPDYPSKRTNYIVYSIKGKKTKITVECCTITIGGKSYDGVDETWYLLKKSPKMLNLV